MYQIKGKIDSSNASEFENEIMEALPTKIDASELKYISSAGLRVLIDMGGVTRGNPIYDLACTFRALFFVPKYNAEICRKSFGLEPELAFEIGKKFFAMYSGITDEQALEEYIQQIRLAFCFFYVAGLSTHPFREKYTQSILDNILRAIILPNADVIKKILS